MSVSVSPQFKLLLTCALLVTIGLRVVAYDTFRNPSEDEVLDEVEPFLRSQNFEVAGDIPFAGKPSLLVRRGDCMVYVMSVAHQGWHEATLLHALTSSQRLSFVFRGAVTETHQDRAIPLATYYASKLLRYIGFDVSYPPMLALASEGTCSLRDIDWRGVPDVAFRRLGLGENGE